MGPKGNIFGATFWGDDVPLSLKTWPYFEDLCLARLLHILEIVVRSLAYVLKTIIWGFVFGGVFLRSGLATSSLLETDQQARSERARPCIADLEFLGGVPPPNAKVFGALGLLTLAPVPRKPAKKAVSSAVMDLSILRQFVQVLDLLNPPSAQTPLVLQDGIYVYGITASGKLGILPRDIFHPGLALTENAGRDVFKDADRPLPLSLDRRMVSKGINIFGEEAETPDAEVVEAFAILQSGQEYVGSHDGLLQVMTDGHPERDHFVAAGSFKWRSGRMLSLSNSTGTYPADLERLQFARDTFRQVGIQTVDSARIYDFSVKAVDPHGAAPVHAQTDFWAQHSPSFRVLVAEISAYLNAYSLPPGKDVDTLVAAHKSAWKASTGNPRPRFSFDAFMSAASLLTAWQSWPEDSDPSIILLKALSINGGRKRWEEIKAVLDYVREAPLAKIEK